MRELFKIKDILGIALLMVGSSAYTDGGCPPGMMPVNGTVTQGCIPMPASYDIPDGGFQQPMEHRDIYWSALAMDKEKLLVTDKEMKFIGVSSKQKSMKEAKKAALAMCESDGSSNCEIIETVINSCLAITISPKSNQLEYSFNGNMQYSINNSMRQCKEKYKDCKIAYSSCQ